MRRFLLCVSLAMTSVWLTSGAALAGGWAVTTLDSLPSEIQAGQTYRVGYVIRQHGERPFIHAEPQIRVAANGQQLSFPGRPEGEPGHYVSDVTFPSGGEWTWFVDPKPFPSQPLGSISVNEIPAAAPEPVLEVHGIAAEPPIEVPAIVLEPASDTLGDRVRAAVPAPLEPIVPERASAVAAMAGFFGILAMAGVGAIAALIRTRRLARSALR